MSEIIQVPQRREDLQQVASLIKTLKQIDQRSQERIADEEREAHALLHNVTEEIAAMEDASRMLLVQAVELEEQRLRQAMSGSLLAAEERARFISQELGAKFEAGFDSWVKQLVSSVLEVKPEDTTP